MQLERKDPVTFFRDLYHADTKIFVIFATDPTHEKPFQRLMYK